PFELVVLELVVLELLPFELLVLGGWRVSCWLRPVTVVVAEGIAIVPMAATSAAEQEGRNRPLWPRTQTRRRTLARCKGWRSQTMTVSTIKKTSSSRSLTMVAVQSWASFQIRLAGRLAAAPAMKTHSAFPAPLSPRISGRK